jgi:hypothetical protein
MLSVFPPTNVMELNKKRFFGTVKIRETPKIDMITCARATLNPIDIWQPCVTKGVVDG